MSSWRRPRSGGYRIHTDSGLGSLTPSPLSSGDRLSSSTASSFSSRATSLSSPFYNKRPAGISSILESSTTSLASGTLLGGRNLHGSYTDRYRQSDLYNTRSESLSDRRRYHNSSSRLPTGNSPSKLVSLSPSTPISSNSATSVSNPSPPAQPEKHHHWRLRVPGLHHHHHHHRQEESKDLGQKAQETESYSRRPRQERSRRQGSDAESKDTTQVEQLPRTPRKVDESTNNDDVIRKSRRGSEMTAHDNEESGERRRRRRSRADQNNATAESTDKNTEVSEETIGHRERDPKIRNREVSETTKESGNKEDSAKIYEVSADVKESDSIVDDSGTENSGDLYEPQKDIKECDGRGQSQQSLQQPEEKIPPEASKIEASPSMGLSEKNETKQVLGESPNEPEMLNVLEEETSNVGGSEGDAIKEKPKFDGSTDSGCPDDICKGSNSTRQVHQGRLPVVQIKIHSCETVDEGDENDEEDSVSDPIPLFS
ncbi:hypothetical protein RRG08_039771 [Elysia crispata]|uniref:Uncharacterized protein n=1 Tax=Elysia crispata TaxID=231223 RepID=A0AAE0ZUM7_9GAST|nr:hypothetical protein RRG08_039771 [Elysia crispata]